MRKFCVFCGERPESKNKEHIIPLWLIELTGDPKRRARFGLDLEKETPAVREFSFDSFTFPACSVCNSSFGALEAEAKAVITRVLLCQALSEAHLNILLDWLDKVRVGLWLGYFYLNKNPLAIRPHYYVSSRLGQTDRSVAILRIAGRQPGINFIGPESFCFQGNPTCFALLINSFCLLNVAGISICSPRLGFPFARPKQLHDDGKLVVSIEDGTCRIRRPIQPDLVLGDAVILHQPIYRNCLASERAEIALKPQWVKANSLHWKEGVGGIFVESGSTVCRYPSRESLDWLPQKPVELYQAYLRTTPFVYKRLIRDALIGARISGKERRRRMLQQIAGFKKADEAHLSLLRHQVKWRRRFEV